MEKYLSQKKLCKLTGLKNSQIDYLVRDEIIPCFRFGKRVQRQFPKEAIEIIKKRQEKLNINHEH
ncbi:MAG: hypothetical protein ISS29_06570 [Candidatus Marinimicrobia bacterium]|nr:hypothetical protein [Candidatus Neomarinimicrobiota bacterium]